MILEILEGQEFYISANRLQDRSYFMYPAYSSALLALINTVRQRRHWERQPRDPQDPLKNCGVSNIIAFSAPRGGGKTSTMQSFAQAISDRDGLQQCSVEGAELLLTTTFRPLPLIAPSVLRPGQGILPVVLSRLFQLAQDLWQQRNNTTGQAAFNRCSGASPLPPFNEGAKSELFRLFQCCLDGVNAIKSQDGTTVDLSRLHELNDGAALRQHFYKLVRQLLILSGMSEGFLVLQLDDADSQVGEGYEMLEDIRKYLMLPNLIILMAADTDMLRTVVFKHHYAQFQTILQQQLTEVAQIKEISEKYLDKLIPPLNVVHLPRHEQFSVQQGNNFHLKYVRSDGNLWDSREDISFQSDVLYRIYQKTGIVFVSHGSYLNNIIPTTLRGLKQLLEILAPMEDIPPVTEAEKKSAQKLAAKVSAQAAVAGKNLARFSDYFVHDWINVKITDAGDREFLKRLVHSPAPDRSQLIRLRLNQRCSGAFSCAPDDYSTAAVAQCIEEASMRNRSQADYLFFFAIRTILSIESHRSVWLQKAEQCRTTGRRPLLFNFSLTSAGLSDTYYMNGKYPGLDASERTMDAKKWSGLIRDTYGTQDELSGFKISEEGTDGQNAPTRMKPLEDAPVVEKLVGRRGYRVCVSYMQSLNLLLRLGDPELPPVKLQGKNAANSQQLLYDAQDTALLVASNWEVQRRLLVDWDALPADLTDTQSLESPSADDPISRIRKIFIDMDKELNDLNEGSVWGGNSAAGLYGAFRELCNGLVGQLDFSGLLLRLYGIFEQEREREQKEEQEYKELEEREQRERLKQLERQQQQLSEQLVAQQKLLTDLLKKLSENE